MEKISTALVSVSLIATLFAYNAYAANPASKEWVLQQIAAHPPVLTAADWKAACTSGSPANSSGCYGNVSSAAFTKVSNYLGGFIRLSNINPMNVPSSVFIKAFFAGTNTPAQSTYLHITLNDSAARCALFTQVGLGVGLGGISTTNPSSGNSSTPYVVLHAISPVTINNTTSNEIYYNAENIGTGVTPLSNVVVPNPIYLLCLGYDTTDSTTAAAVNITAT